ncbi:hypothetical protein [Streptomyces coffeae]|uniref:Cdk-activating kinase assembly factor MAT1 centre domain-containing protein n=1 Tax=Streptomyces coffeae TaxID=621382 RepID=A0ABS1N8I4_9ACTN|nr:hypothetical protein [Streptomyces coffeae]MBL1096395.1 hypothetical protein [Streptomyces coffeae]
MSLNALGGAMNGNLQRKSKQGSLGDSPVKGVDALMEEYRADPDAYMERRASVLRGDSYAEARQRVVAEQNEALRVASRAVLYKLFGFILPRKQVQRN